MAPGFKLRKLGSTILHIILLFRSAIKLNFNYNYCCTFSMTLKFLHTCFPNQNLSPLQQGLQKVLIYIPRKDFNYMQ